MRILFVVLVVAGFASTEVYATEQQWYSGNQICLPPKDDGTYSAPYDAQQHPHDYPTFADADKPGWSCSYQRADGVIIQFGDSRTPQEQWRALWGRANDSNN